MIPNTPKGVGFLGIFNPFGLSHSASFRFKGSGNSEISFKEKNLLEVKIAEKFIGERGRINCSLKESDGFWRWLGIQYVVSDK